METILENIKVLLPFALACWLLLLLVSLWRPQRFVNCFLLMAAGGATLLFIAGLFGEYLSYALLAIIGLCALVLLCVPTLLIINGIQMLKRESKRLANLLSLFLGIFVGIGEIATAIVVLRIRKISILLGYTIPAFIAMSVFYISFIILAFVLYSIYMQFIPHKADYDYIIIHGAGLDGERLTRLLRMRVDKAIEVFNKGGRKAMIIPSGGKGSDEVVSEAQAMKSYLVTQGIPEESILIEDKSTTTMENLKNSKSIIDSREGKKKTALVTSNYHVYRCLVYASKIKLKCKGIGAKVRFYYWPSALIREFVAVFAQKRYLILISLGYIITVVIPIVYIFFR